MIINPTPPPTAAFDGMWISGMVLKLPDIVFTDPVFPQSRGRFTASLFPYNGTHILSTGKISVDIIDLVHKRSTDEIFDAVIHGLVAECERQASKSNIDTLVVIALDPSHPVKVRVTFQDGSQYVIQNCYALCATDPVFTGVFSGVMAEVARQAGLTIA